jgi:hypothetical protein
MALWGVLDKCERKVLVLSFLWGLELEFVVFFWCKAKLFSGGTEQFNPSLELDFFVFSGVKQSYLGETASSIPAFFLTLKLGTLVQEHI